MHEEYFKFEGRRIVDMHKLASDLSYGCHACRAPLHLSSTVNEQQYGLASIIFIRCDECMEISRLETSHTHWTNEQRRGRPAYDINTKATLGMLNAGIGVTHINAFLTAMNVPAWHHKSATLSRLLRKAVMLPL